MQSLLRQNFNCEKANDNNNNIEKILIAICHIINSSSSSNKIIIYKNWNYICTIIFNDVLPCIMLERAFESQRFILSVQTLQICILYYSYFYSYPQNIYSCYISNFKVSKLSFLQKVNINTLYISKLSQLHTPSSI